MDGVDNKTNSLQMLPPKWPRRPTPFNMEPSPAAVPLAPTSFQVWRKPHFTKDPGSSSDANNDTIPSKQKSDNDDSKSSQDPISPSADVVAADDHDPIKSEPDTCIQVRSGRTLDPNMDPKKLKRIVSNRASAQKSRLKKLQYVTDMERKVKALEAQIAILAPQVALYRNQQHLLLIEKKRLNQEISAQTSTKILKEAEIEANRAEVNRLRQLHLIQQRQKMQGRTMMPAWEHGFPQIYPSSIQSGIGAITFMNINQAQNEENSVAGANNVNQFEMRHRHSQEYVLGDWQVRVAQQMKNPSFQQYGSPGKFGGVEHIVPFNQNPYNGPF